MSEEKKMSYPPLLDLAIHKSWKHPLWTACRHIRDNPGCKKEELEAALERAYPVGTRSRFSWVASWGGTKKCEGYGANHGLFERLYKQEGKRTRGFHILPRGREVASLPEPEHKPDRPKTVLNEWVRGDITPGMMLVSRNRTRRFMVWNTPTSVGGSTTCSPSDILLLNRVILLEEWTDRKSMRTYGQPYIHSRLEVIHPNGNLYIADASCVKPLLPIKGGKKK